ncbi:S41 family peptidase [Aquisalimonas asiatica]|uniref:S41 family peptidase n=1 Tax=Aquisalimonas asiatica TaxID=406100 RepID=UPI001FE1AC86|nr:S41 family peptidase [Aquisalimonas asiatica]
MNRLIRHLALTTLSCCLLLPAAATADDDGVSLPRFPSISPDGEHIAFSWGGDLWRAPVSGGDARRLTRHEQDDLHSSWSPDGDWLTFTSVRDGYLNLWRVHEDGTRVSQLTHSDRHLRNPGYDLDADGNPVITFSGLLEADVYRDQRPYVVSPEGGDHRRLHDAFGSEPRLSPDGLRTVFTRGGIYHGWNRRHYRGPEAMDLWLHDHEEDSFRPLTERDGDDGNARWADDRTLVFMSDREGETVNLYRMRLDEDDAIERLTDFNGHDVQHFDVSRDGSTAVVQVWDTLYTLDLASDDAQPRPIALRAGEDGHDRFELKRIDREITEAALSPDGRTMAYIAYGRVYVRHIDEHSPTRPVTRGTHARHKDLSWSPDGLRLYFTNDSDGTESIYQARVALTREEIRSGRIQPSDAIAESPVEEIPPGADPAPEPVDDGIMAVAARSGDEDDADPGQRSDEPEDPFAPVEPGLPPEPDDPPDPALLPEPLDEPDAEPETIPETELDPDEDTGDLPRHRDPARWHDAVQFYIRPMVQTEHNDREASPSPDGNSVAFRRGRGDLMTLDLDTGETTRLVEGWDSNIHWRWSPDSRHIAYSQNNLDFSANIFIVPADGSAAPVNITRHPRNDINPRWSADGRKLSFISNRSGQYYNLYRIYLDRSLENMTRRERATYYRDARAEAAKRRPLPVQRDPDDAVEPVSLDLDRAWRRIERVADLPRHQFANEMTPGGDRFVFNQSGEGLVSMNWDGSDRKRLAPRAEVQHLNVTGDRVIYIADGRVGVVSTTGGSPTHPDISARIRVDLREQALQKFRETARVMDEHFYRQDMNGLDWGEVVAEYEDLIRRTRTASEFSDITNRLLGELAASHTGLSNPGPGAARRQPSGRLGIDYEPVELDDGRRGYRVLSVIPDGPVDRGPARMEPGDVITEIDLEPFHERDTMLYRLRGRVDEEVIVTFERGSGRRPSPARTLVTPVDYSDLATLRYDAFRERSRERVEERSDGRLGYIHIQSMNQTSLEDFQGDLYAAAYDREGLIIDVRNNGGGHTTDRILTSIMTREHAYTIPAGADGEATGHYPQDRLDAPRYTLPINMLANEKSYSNAEILAHAFSTLERGTLVGQQTYGGVISTGSHSLIDGANLRRPYRGWYLPDGTDMEHNGALPDILVEQTPEDEVADRDRQLDRAVDDMLERLERNHDN